MRQCIGFANFFQSGFGHCAQTLFGVRIEHLNATIALCAHFFPANAHGIELVVFDELCYLTHDNSLCNLCVLPKIQSQIKGIEIAPAALTVQVRHCTVHDQRHALLTDAPV